MRPANSENIVKGVGWTNIWPMQFTAEEKERRQISTTSISSGTRHLIYGIAVGSLLIYALGIKGCVDKYSSNSKEEIQKTLSLSPEEDSKKFHLDSTHTSV